MEAILMILALLICTVVVIIGVLYMRPSVVSISDKALDLANVLPIETITDKVIVNGNGDLTIGYKMFLPEVFSLSLEEAIVMQERLLALLRMLPSGTIIHQQNLYSITAYQGDTHTENPIQCETLRYYAEKSILQSCTHLYVTFPYRSGSVRKSAGLSPLQRRYNYPFTKPFKGIDSRLEDLTPQILNLENGLSSLQGVSILRMSSEELNAAVFDYLNLSYPNPTVDATAASVDPISTSSSGELKIGNQYVAILSLTREGELLHELKVPATSKSRAMGTHLELPENISSKTSMIYPIGLGLPFEHIVNVVIEITDSDATISTIRSEQKALNFLRPFYSPAEEKMRVQDIYCQEITQFDRQTACTAVNLILHDADRGELIRKTSLAKQAFASMNQSSCYVENAETANLFFASMPGAGRTLYRGHINTVEQALCYLQKDNLYLSSLTGYVFGDRFGNPVKIEMWNNPALNNKNKIVIGPSGSGKSFFLNNYILQTFEKGTDVVIIDIGGSYRSMVDLNRGKYYDSSHQEDFKFNPFLCDQDRHGRWLYMDESDPEGSEDLINCIVAILSYIWREQSGITPTERAILRKSIISYYESINNSSERSMPNLIGYRAYLREFEQTLRPFEADTFRVDELMLLLEPYTIGELSYLLNSTSNIDIVHDTLLAFDMEAVSKKKYFPLVGILILQLIADKIKRRQGVRKELIIDEALDFLKDEKFGDFIAYLYRTFRKKEGGITIAAQNVLFLKSAPPVIRDSILINCDTKIILDHSQYRSEYDNLRSILSLSESEIGLIDSLQSTPGWREFFLKLGNTNHVFRNEVSPFAAVAFDSRQRTVVRLRELFESTGSTYAAIRQYLHERALTSTDS